MPRLPVALFLAWSAVFVCNTAFVGAAAAAGGGQPVNVNEVPSTAVATEQKPATVKVQGDTGGAALEVTARPVRGDDSSPPYLVGVFVGDGKPGSAPAKMLGSFSFYPARAGESQKFIIPKPQLGDTPPGKELTVSVKLIPANPARDIKDAAVEILGARLVR
jgi:hypothetical protein